jgi:hypothetical protein
VTSPSHVSAFELDLHFVDGKDAAIAAHVARCPGCAGYLAALRALEADGTRLPAPVTARPARRGASLRRFVAPAATVLALAAGLALWARSRNVTDESYVGVKGAPALQVLVRDSTQTRVWDGHSAVHAGDALALHVACEQLAHVTVTTEDPHGLVRLWDGPCPRPSAALPFTLRVDDQPGRERFAVVLARTRLDDLALRSALRDNARAADVWVISVELPKEAR